MLICSAKEEDFVNEEDKQIERIVDALDRLLANRNNHDVSAQKEAAAFAKSQVSEFDLLRKEIEKHYATKEYVQGRMLGYSIAAATIIATIATSVIRLIVLE